ncbi:MAG: tetratricopeptide repeat protein [Planctomycetota bacterium]
MPVGAATQDFFRKLAKWTDPTRAVRSRPDQVAAHVDTYLQQLDAPLVEADERMLLALIAQFRQHDRPRARLRWTLRAFGLLPESERILQSLIGCYLEQGRLKEAYLVVGAALHERPEDVPLWQERLKIALWDSNMLGELEAREALHRLEPSNENSDRLVSLYRDTGRAEDAVVHAEALYGNAEHRNDRMQPILLALEGGAVDVALELLEKRAATAKDPAWWHERALEFAFQDHRVERVLQEARWLYRHDPARYAAQLEKFLRRRDRVEELADFLEERLQREPDNAEVEQELLDLRAGLGQHDKARTLLERRLARIESPEVFFARLPVFEELGLAGVAERMRAMAASPELQPEAAVRALESLRAFIRLPICAEAARTIARRYARLPEARNFLVFLADQAPEDADRAAEMEELARAHFEDAGYVGAWAERAGWAGDLEGETEARARLVELAPGDLDNRRKLADLYEAQNRLPESVEQWRVIAAAEGLESRAQLRLVDALLANDQLDEAMAILEQRARLPSASINDQLYVANELFGKGQFDRALRLNNPVLEREPEHAEALLRAGRIRAWTNDPRNAIPLLERRLAVSEDEADAVRFTLGECHWAIGNERQGRAAQEQALAGFLARTDRTVAEDVMTAKMLARFGRFEEARPLFDRVLAAQPDNVDLVLDYADSMLAVQDLPRARALVDQARGQRPHYVRGMRLDGNLALREKRYGDAALVLRESLERFGPDAGTTAALGRAEELAGDFDRAHDSYTRAFKLAPENEDLAEVIAAMEDVLAGALQANATYRTVGDDTAFEAWLAGTSLWKRGRTRLGAAIGYARYEGPAEVRGFANTTASILNLDLSLTHRFHNRNRIGGGVTLFPGANGNTPISGWIGAHLHGESRYWSVRARGWVNELFFDPAAAAGLGGRTSGVRVEGDVDIGKRFWIGGGLRYENLSLDDAGQTPSDPRVVASVTVGWRAIQGATRVSSPLRVRTAPFPGVIGARLPEIDPEAGRNALAIWLNATTYQLLGDAELTTFIPIGERFDYLLLAARYDRHLGAHFGFMAEGYAGIELQEDRQVYGVSAGLGWRPSHTFELTFMGAYGSALGRSNDEDSFAARVGLTWRW